MPNGDQYAAYRVFELKAGEAKEIYLEAVKKELDELLEHIELPEITLEDLDGKAHTLNDLTKDGPILLAFLGTGEEPTGVAMIVSYSSSAWKVIFFLR